MNEEKNTIINIMLGTACNWSCPYCLQSKQPGFDRKKDVELFCDKLLEYLKTNNINKLRRICYWGGEPLLYKNYVYTVEKRLSHIPHLKSNRVITNGSLIDDEFIDFANNYKMLVNLSYHDGQLDDNGWEKALHIRQLYVTSLIRHGELNWDKYFTKWRYIHDTFGRCVNWYIYPVRATPGVPEQYWLTKEDIDQYFDYLNWVVDKAYENVFYNRMVQILFYNMKNIDYGFDIKNKCFNETVLSVDLDGNRYFCHHDCASSNITSNIFKDNQIDKIPANLKSMGDKCDSCPIFSKCLGGCFRDLTPEVTCYYNLKLYSFLKDVSYNHPTLVHPRYYKMLE